MIGPLLKLFDKLLQLRVSPLIQAATFPWQSGGSEGADDSAWLLVETLKILRSQGHHSKILMAFIDAESAFCRPPPEMILDALADIRISPTTWKGISSILGQLIGCLLSQDGLWGEWPIESGVPQGGALSLCLFIIILLSLYRELCSLGVGVKIKDSQGTYHTICLRAFVDDLVLLATDIDTLHKALGTVTAWARRLRLKLNVGPTKSAIMAWGPGRPPTDLLQQAFCLGEVTMPWICEYKYLGVWISSGGGWSRHLRHICDKMVSKTAEIARWCDAHGATVDVACLLWQLYVYRAALFGASLLDLPVSSLASLDRCHRKTARMLLSFSPSCPTPCPLAELGWQPLTSDLDGERARLFSRLIVNPNTDIKVVLDATALSPDSWASQTAATCGSWCDGILPTSRGAWHRLLQKWSAATSADEADLQHNRCQQHHYLAHYHQAKWELDGKWALNSFIYDPKIDPHVAKSIGRLLAGAQDLRAGDPKHLPEASVDNCCVHCLMHKIKVPETLLHFTFDCPAYARLRLNPATASLLERGNSIFTHHRDIWSWSELRRIRALFQDMLAERATMCGVSLRRTRSQMTELAVQHWHDLDPSPSDSSSSTDSQS